MSQVGAAIVDSAVAGDFSNLFAASSEKSSQQRGLAGLVVNRRVSDSDAHVLDWIGFDVVEASASDFIDDLAHYTAHVRAGGRTGWPLPDRSCLLKGAQQ